MCKLADVVTSLLLCDLDKESMKCNTCMESVNNKWRLVSANHLCNTLTTIKRAMNDWRQQVEDIYEILHQTPVKYIFFPLHFEYEALQFLFPGQVTIITIITDIKN